MGFKLLYLIPLVAFLGVTWAYPYSDGRYHFKVVYTGDDELNRQTEQLDRHELLGSKMCTRGPSYWCHNITHAAECHAMQHCIQKVWENPKEKLPEDRDSVCEVCLDMVKQARDQLLSNETQDELRQVLEGSCNYIPVKLVAKECDELVDNFIPELIDALTSRMDPQMVCHISGLCNSVRIDEMLGEMKEIDGPKKIKALDPHNFNTCPECKHYVGEFVNTLKRLTKDDLRVQLLSVCGHMGSFSESCRQAVIHEMDAIYTYLQQNMQPKQICNLIGLCVESTLIRVPLEGQQRSQAMTNVRVWQPPQGKKNDDMECDFCKQLTESVRQWLVANNTEDEFVKVLEGLCKQTGKYKQECLSLAEQYGKAIYQTLTDELNPDEVCQAIGICHNNVSLLGANRAKYAPIWTIIAIDDDNKQESSDDDRDESLPLMKLLPAERLAGDDEMKPTATKIECEFCQYALHHLQVYLGNATTEDEIKEKVETYCTKIPQRFVDQCQTFVEEYGEALVVLLAQAVDPSQVCPKLHLCQATTTPQPLLGQPMNVKDILPTCALCTFTIEKIIHLVGKNMTKDSVDRAMEGICLHFPKHYEADCMSFMKNYGDEAAEMILVYGTSHGVCAALHLCLMAPAPTSQNKIIVNDQLPLDRYLPQTVTLDRVNQLEVDRDDSRRCVMCEFVITTLDQRLKDNATEEEIKQEVEHICSYLPKTVRGKCEIFVEAYGEQIIQYLSQEMDPENICTQIGLCQKQNQNTDNSMSYNLKMNKCQLCMFVSDYVSTILAEEDSDKDIDTLAKRTCVRVPKEYQKQCTVLIEDYGEYIVNLLKQETDSGKVCAQIQLCPKTGNKIDVEDDDAFEY